MQELCDALRSTWYLTSEEIDALLANKDFFQPYLRNALAQRARIGRVSESPIDATDGQAIFLLTELGDTEIVPDLITCLSMSEKDLRLLYGDSLTEHMWLPFARLGYNHLEKIWEFATDSTADLFARGAAVSGVAAMHHFHPERRAESVAFVERLLSRTDVFPVDHLAGILCDCADSGLAELAERAEQFAANMDDDEPYPMATGDDVRKAFRDGAQADFISRRPHDVYAINRQWQRWAERQEEEDGEDDLEIIEDEDEPREFFDIEPSKSKRTSVGRNEPCPCGSGKKYKKCHGV